MDSVFCNCFKYIQYEINLHFSILSVLCLFSYIPSCAYGNVFPQPCDLPHGSSGSML